MPAIYFVAPATIGAYPAENHTFSGNMLSPRPSDLEKDPNGPELNLIYMGQIVTAPEKGIFYIKFHFFCHQSSFEIPKNLLI